VDNESPYFEDLDDHDEEAVAGYPVGFFVILLAAVPFLLFIKLQEVIYKFK
jgi:hypothetical protein